MIKKVFLLAAIAFTSVFTVNAQEAPIQKSRMYVKVFTKTPGVSDDDLSKVRAAVISSLNKSERFELLDASSETAITEEALRRQSEAAMHDETARKEMIATKANNYVMDGVVTACEVKSKAKDGKSAFTCVLSYSVTITDIANNTTVATKKFEHSPLGIGGTVGKILEESTSAEGAKTSAINLVDNDITDFLIEEFPLKGEIYAEDFVIKKDKLTHCYINIGKTSGVKVGDWFAIMEQQTKVGKTINKVIGRLKVVEVDEEIANCKVSKGEKEVKKAMDRYMENSAVDEKTPLLMVKSIPEPLLAF